MYDSLGITKPQKYEHQEEIELIASNYGITSEQTVFFVSQKFGINHNQKTNLNTNTSSLDSSTYSLILCYVLHLFEFNFLKFKCFLFVRIVLLSYDAGVLPMEEYNTELPEDQNVNKHTTHQKRIYQTDLLLQFKNVSETTNFSFFVFCQLISLFCLNRSVLKNQQILISTSSLNIRTRSLILLVL